MNHKEKSAAVIKFGGSASTNERGANPDYFAPTLASIHRELRETFSRAVLVIGGGPRVRAAQANVHTDAEKDRIGMEILREHGSQLAEFATRSGLDADSRIARNEDEAKRLIADSEAFSLVLGGLKKGQSTDAVAITAAEYLLPLYENVRVAILSNVWRVFTADPKTNPDARPLVETDLQQLIELGVLFDDPKKFVSGMNIVLDPVAVAKLLQIPPNHFPEIWFGHADDKQNLRNFLVGKKTNNGTRIAR